MPISFVCDCGKQLTVGDEFAGKRARCPACAAVRTVPDAAPVQPLRARRVNESDDEDDEERPRPLWQDEAPEVVSRRRRRAERDADERREQRRKKARAEVIGGGVAMTLGAVWFALVVFAASADVDLDLDVIVYPPILFVGGMVSLILGLAGPGDEK